jgi:uncharacterized protein (TIGR00255 family)
MVTSMTGYGKATKDLGSTKITVQIKSLNSKGIDLNVKLPSLYREKELEVRSMLSNLLQRGKIDMMLTAENQDETSKLSINKELFKSHYTALKQLKADLGDTDPSDLIRLVCGLPDVMVTETKELDENEWKSIMEVIKEAVKQLELFRQQEGDVLKEEFTLRVSTIAQLLEDVKLYEEDRIKTVRERITKHLDELISADNYDKDRLEQELVFYMEKFDVTEEKVRLKGHCDYFISTMNEDGAQGKKLGFISQEMGREINTLGSKANDSNIQKLVVGMKDELEKIKEQVLNTL